MLRLFHVDAGHCRYTKDIVPGIFACSQIEMEFAPYVSLGYMPYRSDVPGGVILQTKKRTIRKNYDFSPKTIKQDTEDLRKMIWYYLRQDHNITDITDVNGCLIDFRKYKPNNVIQGWQAKKRELKKDKCCKLVLDNLTSEIVKHNILHEVYRLSGKDKQNRNICKKVRGEECGNNYAPNSDTYDLCMNEVNWLCNNGYPKNKLVEKASDIAKQIREKIYRDLVKSNMKVNKRKFDELISAGLFQDLGNRMGNKVANYENVKSSLDNIMDEKGYYLSLIEGFEEEQKVDKKTNGFGDYGILVIVLMILILIYTQKN